MGNSKMSVTHAKEDGNLVRTISIYPEPRSPTFSSISRVSKKASAALNAAESSGYRKKSTMTLP